MDFFTPIVDDPYAYGAIAAANSLSDIYAMGGKPLSALALLAIPEDKVPKEVVSEIMIGASEKLKEAGCILLGGHSIKNPEPVFGLSVTGTVDPRKIVRLEGARPGDHLFLTKPIGTGILTTALKRDLASPEEEAEAVAWMSKLNDEAARLMVEVGVSAATDVTGFGLLGHLRKMLEAGQPLRHSERSEQSLAANRVSDKERLGAELSFGAVPKLMNLSRYVETKAVPGGTMANYNYVKEIVSTDLSEEETIILSDAQTSGGLLVAVPENKVKEFTEKGESIAKGQFLLAKIGRITKGTQIIITR